MFGLNIDTKVLIYASIAVIVVGSIVIYVIRSNRKTNKDIQEIKDVMIKQHKYAETNFIEISNLFKSMNLRIENKGSQRNVQFSNPIHSVKNVKEEEIEDEEVEEVEEVPKEVLKVPRQNIVVTAIYERPVQTVEKTDIEVIEDEDRALEEAERLLNNNDIVEQNNEIESGCKDGVCDINSVLSERVESKEEIEESINIPIKQSKKKVKKV